MSGGVESGVVMAFPNSITTIVLLDLTVFVNRFCLLFVSFLLGNVF